MTKQILLVVGHGSRVSQAVDQFHQFTAALAKRVDVPVSSCFLELVDPDMATGLTAAATEVGPGGQVFVLPLFLGAAGHLKNDVAVAVQWAREQFTGVTFRYGTALGPHAKLIDLLALRVQEAFAARPNALPPEESIVLVIGRGSSDPTSNSEIARAAYLLLEKRPYHSVEFAFQAVARPKVADGLRRCAQLGAKQIVVAPYILFTGKVDEFILKVTQQAEEELGLPALPASYLGVHPLAVDVAEQRVRELVAGSATMTCDICKYRFPMAGYEHQVGQEQTASHGQAEALSTTRSNRAEQPLYPINLARMSGQRAVVVGGGPVGERKVKGLLAVGAQVEVISPEATARLRAWAEAGRIAWQPRPYQAGDLSDAFLVFAVTNQRAVNARIAQDAAALNLLSNIADAPEEGDFYLPAVYRQAEVTVAVSTSGQSPGRAAWIRDRIAKLLATLSLIG